MYKYQLYQDNPEGIDFVMDLEHEKLFSNEEFSILMENIICETFEDMLKNSEQVVFKSHLDEEILVKHLELNGLNLSSDIPQACYGYSPFGSCSTEKLANMLDKIDASRSSRHDKIQEQRSNNDKA